MNVFSHIRLDRISSTNDFAQFLVSKTKPKEGTVISSVEQYAGRGQVGRLWHTSPGKSITMSVILYPDHLHVHKQFELNKLLSVSVVSVLEELIQEEKITIKWPNDIYCRDKKIAGLLVQVASMGKFLRHAILGIGLNVFEEDFPGELQNPISLHNLKSDLPEIPKIIFLIWSKIIEKYVLIKREGGDLLSKTYLDHLYRKGENTRFYSQERGYFEGNITGVDKSGKLIVEDQGGAATFRMHEIRMIID